MEQKKILLAFTGSVASVKAEELVLAFQRQNFLVQCVVSKGATHFCDVKNLEKITQFPVLGPEILEKKYTEENFRDEKNYDHIFASKTAKAIVIAPASANAIARLSLGFADDFLSALVLAATCPVFFAPAMNEKMLMHLATQKNINILKNDLQYIEIPSQENGVLACGELGKGKMAEVDKIVDMVVESVEIFENAEKIQKIFLGKKVLINTGGTQEKIDPVRYIGNFSTGKTGKILAEVFQQMGGSVELVVGNTTQDFSAFVHTKVQSAEEMKNAMDKHFDSFDIVVFSAAVADFCVHNVATEKIKKSANLSPIVLTPTVDIAKELSKKKSKNQFFIGFCLETTLSTEELKMAMKKKAESKKFDLVLGNSPENFGTENGKFLVYFSKSQTFEWYAGEKRKIFAEVFSAFSSIS